MNRRVTFTLTLPLWMAFLLTWATIMAMTVIVATALRAIA